MKKKEIMEYKNYRIYFTDGSTTGVRRIAFLAITEDLVSFFGDLPDPKIPIPPVAIFVLSNICGFVEERKG